MTDNEFRESWNFSKMVAINIGSVTLSKDDVLAIDDFINRQKETIEQLQTALFKCGEDAAEIENYKEIAEYQQGVSMNMFFDIKRLKEEIERLQKENYEIWEERESCINKAVKEFAERLKAECGNIARVNFCGVQYYCVGFGLIDNLVKEFTGGGDGNQSL